VLIVSTDRISAFDVVMANGIPSKGQILNQLSAFWFSELAAICPHHLISVEDSVIAKTIGDDRLELKGRTMLARNAKTLPIECVVRGYLSGSLLKEYRASGGNIHGLALADGLTEASKLAEPIFTPATKAEEGHDENISFEDAANLVGTETAQTVRDWSLRLFNEATKRCAKAGLILADTKFEFGVTDDGLLWIDEALTPDSSRFWSAEYYKPGVLQPSYDKQFVRNYLETLGWNKLPPGPELPQDVVEKTRAKYIEAYQRITGRAFECVSPSP
jgi:phosphoribosylaminoimidazole-succinocarboxamide synthase